MDSARRPTGPVIAILIVLGAFVVGQVILGLPLYLMLFGFGGPRTGSPTWQLFTTVVLFGFALLALYLWVRLQEGRPFATVGFRSRPGMAALGAVLGFAMFAGIVLVGTAAGQFRTEPIGTAVGAAAVGGVLLALAGFVVQGSTEEILIRGYLLQAVARRWGLVAAVAVQTAVFALLHGINPGSGVLPLVNIALVAVFLVGWALLEGGLWGVCAWHAVWNWTQGNVWGLPVSGLPVEASLLRTGPAPGSTELLTGGDFGPEGSVITTAVLVLGIGAVVALWRRRAG